MRAALIAIALWATLASLAFNLKHLPPFFLTGVGLCIGALVLAPAWRQWRVPAPTLLIGAGALLAYHAALFAAFQLAPPVKSNLLNYLWPLLIVLLAPLYDGTQKLGARSLFAGVLGFSGAALAISGAAANGVEAGFSARQLSGYVLALCAALIWSNYSLLLRKLPMFPSAAVGGFNLLAGVGALMISAGFEPWPTVNIQDELLLILIGAGPLGVAFFWWDRAAKTCAPSRLGVLSFLTPVLSTALLMLLSQQWPGPDVWISAALVLAATALVLWPQGR